MASPQVVDSLRILFFMYNPILTGPLRFRHMWGPLVQPTFIQRVSHWLHMGRTQNSKCGLWLQTSPTLSLAHASSLCLCLPWTQTPALSSWASWWLWSSACIFSLACPVLYLHLFSWICLTHPHSCSASPYLFSELDLAPQTSGLFPLATKKAYLSIGPWAANVWFSRPHSCLIPASERQSQGHLRRHNTGYFKNLHRNIIWKSRDPLWVFYYPHWHAFLKELIFLSIRVKELDGDTNK